MRARSETSVATKAIPPPIRVRITFSRTNWPTSAAFEAPKARRTPISPARSRARLTDRFTRLRAGRAMNASARPESTVTNLVTKPPGPDPAPNTARLGPVRSSMRATVAKSVSASAIAVLNSVPLRSIAAIRERNSDWMAGKSPRLRARRTPMKGPRSSCFHASEGATVRGTKTSANGTRRRKGTSRTTPTTW